MSQNISSNIPLNQYRQYQQPSNTNFTATPAAANISDKGVVQNNPLLNAAANPTDNPLSFLAAAGVSTAALMGINNFVNKPLQNKEYNQTFFKKIETFIDKYATKPKAQSFFDKLRGLKAGAKNLINKSEILRTLTQKPSIGGPQVQSQAASVKGHLASRAIEAMKKYKAEYKLATGNEFKEFDAILKKAEKDSYKYYDDIIRTIKGSSADLSKVISKKPWWGAGIVKNKVSLQEILNKDILIKNYKTAGKSIGQKVSGYLMRGMECLTNGMFSGKGQVLIQALMIAQSASEASKAEKGEKFSTFMASFAELASFLATMGIQMRVVNHLAGLKYIGMSPENVKKYQKAMEIANKAAAMGNKKAYGKMCLYMENLKQAAKANTKWYQKPFKWIGNLVSFGRIKETLKPLKATKAATAFAKIPYGLKVGLGYAGRIALLMGVVVPIFSGIAKKISYAIFGKPVKTLEREKLKEEAEAQAMEQQTQTVQPTQPMQQPQTPQAVAPTQQSKPGNLYDQLNNKYNQPISSQPMYPSTPAASTLRTPEENAGIRRSYIPNPILGVENTVNPASTRSAQIDAVLRQADIVEAQAQRYL